MLFLSDLNKLKARGYKPFIDYDTKSTSFLRTAELLQKLGVKNHFFSLVTYNEELRGIDPHDPVLNDLNINTNEAIRLRTLVMDECMNNPWYYYREVVRLRAQGAAERIRFEMNRGELALIWLMENHVETYIELPRQKGKSFTCGGIVSKCMGLTSTNSNYGLLTKDRKLAGDFSKYVDNFLTGLPNYLKFKNKFDRCNSEIVTVKRLNNQLHIMVCQDNPDDAKNVGRGLSLAGIIGDETNFQDNLDITWASLQTTGSAAKEFAKRSNAPYFTIISSTAGDLSTKKGRYGRSLFDSSLPFQDVFYDLKDEEELHTVIAKNNLLRLRNKIVSDGGREDEVKAAPTRVLVSYGYRALGLTDEWYETKKVEFNYATEEDAQNELNNVWKTTGSNDVLTPEEAKRIKDSMEDPVYVELTEDNFIVNWYIPKEEVDILKDTRQMVMGVDPSNALGGDAFPFIILDTDTAETLATGIYSQTNLVSLNEWFVKWFERFPNNFIMIIENRSTGAALIDTIVKYLLSRNINPLTKLFNWVVDTCVDSAKYAEILKESNRKLGDLTYFAGLKSDIGFTTSSKGRSSRDKLYGEAFRSYIQHCSTLCKDKTLAGQYLTLTTKNGKVEAGPGFHDDMVIVSLLVYWFLLYGKNKEKYGLDTTRILNKALYNSLGEEGVDLYIKNKLILDKIDELKDLLNNANNELDMEYYNKQLDRYYKKAGIENEAKVLEVDRSYKNMQLQRNEHVGDKMGYMKNILKRKW